AMTATNWCGAKSARRAVLADNGFVDANPQTGPLRHQQGAVIQNEWVAQELVAQRVMRTVEFDNRLVLQRDRVCGMWRWRDRRKRMQRGSERDAGTPDMRDRDHAEARRQGLNLQPLGEAAADAQIRLRDVDALANEQVAKTVARVFAFAAGDRNG